MSVEAQLQALLTRHCVSLADEMTSIGVKLSQVLLATESYHELVSETAEMVHRVNGSSGSLGFLELSSAARKFEEALNYFAQSAPSLTDAGIRELHRLFSEMQSKAEQTKPEDSRLFSVDLS